MTTTNGRVLAILPTFRRQELLADTLEKVLQQTRRPDCVVVVDNEASEVTRGIVEACAAAHDGVDVRYLAAPDNLGSAGGWALGMNAVLGEAKPEDWMLTLDDDDPPMTTEELERIYTFAVEQRAARPDLGAVGIVGARFNWRTGYLVRPDDVELAGPVLVDYVGSGHGAMYSVHAMQRLGVFRGDLFFGHTEIEYCLRLRRAQFSVVAHGDMWRERRAGAGRLGLKLTPDRSCKIDWRRYYVTRNYIFMMRQFHRSDLAFKRAFIQTIAKPLYTLLSSPRTAYRGFRLGWRASIDGFRGRMGRTFDPTTFPL